jgi:hypothetical protein
MRQAIVNALNAVGGERYLAEMAGMNMSAFAGLLGRCVSTQVSVDANVQVNTLSEFLRRTDAPK